MSEVAAFVAWLGGAVIMLADARRGLAAGLVLVAVAAAGLTWAAGDLVGALVLLAGGLIAAALRYVIGPDGWGLMEPGSTPRLLFTVIAGLVTLWVAVAVTSGGSGGLRFGAIAILVLLTGRLLQGGPPAALLTATSGLALALGIISGPLEPGGGVAFYVVAALVTAGVSAMPLASPARPTRPKTPAPPKSSRPSGT